LNADIPAPDTVADLLRKANTEMLSLSARLAEIDEKSAPQSSVQKS